MQFTIAACAATLLGLASAQNVHVVSVGSTNGSLIFSPDNIKANPGEMIQFQFRGGNHSVVQSSFDSPCTPISQSGGNSTGMFSGYMPVAASEAMGMIPTYTVMVADAKPMWLYCSQGKHCQNGMVMVVNENPGANVSRTLTQFKALAAQATANLAPGGTATGGSTGSGSTDSGSGTSTGSDGASSTGDAASASGSAAAGTAAGSTLAVTGSLGLLSAAAAAFMLL